LHIDEFLSILVVGIKKVLQHREVARTKAPLATRAEATTTTTTQTSLAKISYKTPRKRTSTSEAGPSLAS
jgi:hypothetical protein